MLLQMMKDNLIESDGKAVSSHQPAIQFIPSAPSNSFGSVVGAAPMTIAPAVPPKAPPSSTEDAALKARLEVAEIAIAK